MHNDLIGLLGNYFEKDAWNYKHSLAAKYWMERLIEGEGGNSRVLIPAATLHDIGYGVAAKGKELTLDERRAIKERHMQIGADEVRRVLPSLGYSSDEIDRIAHLVGVHDVYWELKEKDELMLFEADTLAAMDVRRVKPNYNQAGWDKYLKTSILGGKAPTYKSRGSLFTTETGWSAFKDLLSVALRYSLEA